LYPPKDLYFHDQYEPILLIIMSYLFCPKCKVPDLKPILLAGICYLIKYIFKKVFILDRVLLDSKVLNKMIGNHIDISSWSRTI